jgi:redox-sensing transcriptional repressor
MAEKNKMKGIPKATIKRLALYARALYRIEMDGETRVSSMALAERLGINPAQVRKDLAYFGQFGVPGYGYRTSELHQKLKSILGTNREIRVALVGAGNLGRALLSYVGFSTQGFRFVAAFDTDQNKIGRVINNIEILSSARMEEVIRDSRVVIAVLAVPAQTAQEIANRLVKCGITAILNFSPTRLLVPPKVKVHYVDLALEMESLSFYLNPAYF